MGFERVSEGFWFQRGLGRFSEGFQTGDVS